MNSLLSEKEYQHFIMAELEKAGYVIRQAKSDYDKALAMDRGLVLQFLDTTQPKAMATLRKIYGDDAEDIIIQFINREITKDRGSLLHVLRHGVEMNGQKLTLMYRKPATSFNPDLQRLYESNIFSLMEEVVISESERIDVVLFINGLAIMSFELKCNPAGQTYEDAVRQYRLARDPKNRLFLFKAGCLVNFAMDLREVYMTTKLAGKSTFFLPFNMGNGTGIATGSGNPNFPDKFSVSYMWEKILQKDSVTELIQQFIFLDRTEKRSEKSSRVYVTEKLIFPRYHQLDVIRKLLGDVYINLSSRNYLIQHSAGSGKTNSIAWLAHRLTSLHDEKERIIFDKILVITDRVVVDRQLQDAVRGLEHKSGLIKVMDDSCTSADLAAALMGGVKIIGTTIQKFPYIVDAVKELKNRRFAVIIDEAHSSTAGKDMAAVTVALSAADNEPKDVEDAIVDMISRHGKQDNVSFFAFTATPKATTLGLFGTLNRQGQYEPFHVYSMKQAIEEGFILDVLQNYVEYKTFCQLNKKVVDDPMLKTDDAKRQIARFVALHDTNIAQRIEIIIEHFRTTVQGELGGKAKAMVIMASREEAVKYKLAFDDYVRRKRYQDIHAIVAFSGKVKLKHDDTEYSEGKMNGFSEKKTPGQFDTEAYQLLLVANKYQTGFDQPKLCAMYVLKKLKGVAAVQTLSRLNRIYPPYSKTTFILDFVNTCDDIVKAFAPYYTATILSNSVSPQSIYNIEARLDEYGVIDMMDVDAFAVIYHKAALTAKDKQRLVYLVGNTIEALKKKYNPKEQREFAVNVKHFIRFYEFLIQVTCFEDVELHKKYEFLTYVIAELHLGSSGSGVNLEGKIEASRFQQKKGKETQKPQIVAGQTVAYAATGPVSIAEAEKEKLSQIIEDINRKMGKDFDVDVASKAMLQIRDLMVKSERLKRSAASNDEANFAESFYSDADDVLIDGLTQNQEFYSMLLNDEDLKKSILGVFVPEIYRQLRHP